MSLLKALLTVLSSLCFPFSFSRLLLYFPSYPLFPFMSFIFLIIVFFAFIFLLILYIPSPLFPFLSSISLYFPSLFPFVSPIIGTGTSIFVLFYPQLVNHSQSISDSLSHVDVASRTAAIKGRMSKTKSMYVDSQDRLETHRKSTTLPPNLMLAPAKVSNFLVLI